MIYVLDTNALSALMKGSTAVVERLAATPPADIAVPQPVIAEIAFGIERLPRSKRRAALQARFDFIAAELPRAEWTDVVSRTFAASRQSWNAGEPGLRTSTPPLRHMLSFLMRHSSRQTLAT